VGAKFGPCQDCVSLEANDCPLYLCYDDDGFVIACCIVYVINHNLHIHGKIDGLLDYDDD
jgi:hypothetical protein